MKKVIILSDKIGWHCNQIRDHAEKQGYSVNILDIRELSLHLENETVNVIGPDNEIIKYTNILIRHIPGGTLEEIIYYLNILKALEINQCNVINKADLIEKTVDKAYTTMLLSKYNILTPDTWVVRDIDILTKKFDSIIKDSELIYKPMFGSQGENITKITTLDDINKINNQSNIFYIQRFIKTNPSHDYRVLIIKGKKEKSIYAMTRYGKTYINNYSSGAKCVPLTFDKQIIRIATTVADLFDLPICGVDLIKDDKNLYVLEVNSVPAWKGMQSTVKENISSSIVNHLFMDIDETENIQKKI